MQQRRLRLGDILDDYCPRERRITNHAVVAMIEDEVKQTRCTTCDADHEYKQARVPVRRKKDAPTLVSAAGRIPRPRAAAGIEAEVGQPEPLAAEPFDIPEVAEAPLDPVVHASPEPLEAAPAVEEPEPPRPDAEEDGPVHRRLIRATLPRPEGQTPEWKDPEFTIRQPGGRGPDGNRNGHRHGGRGGASRRPARAAHGGGSQGPTRFGQSRPGGNTRHGSGQPPGPGGNRAGRPGQGHGQGHGGHGQGHGHGQSRGQRQGGRKRGR
jgi:hypothetical protein